MSLPAHQTLLGGNVLDVSAKDLFMNELLDLALHEEVAELFLAVFKLREELGGTFVLNLDDVEAGRRLHGLLGHFALLQAADRFGELFDGGVISYACHLVKPEKAIYEKLIADCGLDPAHTLFIDDTLSNVEAAMKMGINGFHMHEKGMMDRFFL